MVNISALELAATCKDTNFKILVDIGAQKNYISKKLVNSLQLKQIKNDENKRIVLADGTECTVNYFVNVEFEICSFKPMKFKIEAYVLTMLPSDLHIGLDFLKIVDANINLRDLSIQLSEVKFPFLNSEEYVEFPDREIYDKVGVIKNQEDIDKIVEKYRQTNLKIIEIGNIEHSIKLKSNDIICCKPFRTPLKLKEPLREEIKTLLSNKIIKHSNSFYASPAFPIIKKNGKVRKVVDYRKLNAKQYQKVIHFLI
ncbi:MAG: aspartyl protease family protein [Fusobacteriaceae bacterium]